MSILVPVQDLAPSVASRLVTIQVTDLTEGGVNGAPGSVTFTLPGDLRVPADDVIVRAGAVTVDLDENGYGEVRLPTHDADALGDGVGSDWYLLVSKSWSQQVDMIRVPAGTGSISLADINPVVEVTPAMGQWLITNASAEIVEGSQWGVTVTTAGGIARFKFTVPPGGVAWRKGSLTSSDSADALRGSASQGIFQVASSMAGLPKAWPGWISVLHDSASGRTQQEFWSSSDVLRQRWVRTTEGTTAWTPWRVSSTVMESVASGSLNDIRQPGMYPVTGTSAVQNLPSGQTGVLEVLATDSTLVSTIQKFTVGGARPKEFVRGFSSGAWQPWVSMSPSPSAINAGSNLDTVTGLGSYEVTNSGVAGLPVASVGVLEVLYASGTVLQRFTRTTGVPAQYIRSQSGGTWSSWSLPGASTALESRVAAVEAKTLSLPVARSPLDATPATVEEGNPQTMMVTMSRDRSRGWNGLGSVLRETRDDGRTWTDKITFPGRGMEGAVALDNDTLFVTAGDGASGLRKWMIVSNLDAATPTWTDVRTGRVPSMTYPPSWSISAHENILLVNEYGPKAGVPRSGYGDGVTPVTVEDGARYTYLSLDYGRTWRTIFDLYEYLDTEHGAVPQDMHLHGVLWDPYWDRIWVTFGDSNDGIVYSDDLGETWHTAVWSPVPSSATQSVGMVAMPQCVLFGSDNYAPSTVYRINRTDGKKPTGTYTLDSAWEWSGSGKHLLQGHCRIARPGDDAPALFSFAAEGAAAPSVIVGTLDGYLFEDLWVDSEVAPAGRGSRGVLGPTLRGEVVAYSNWFAATEGWKSIRFRATGY